jgi:hypothetical protein
MFLLLPMCETSFYYLGLSPGFKNSKGFVEFIFINLSILLLSAV